MTSPSRAQRLPPVGVQLYTLRSELEHGLPHVLSLAADCGYSSVELFGGFFGLAPARLREELAQRELAAVAAHVPIETLEGDDLPRLLDDYEAVGCRCLVCPWLAPERRGGEATYRELGQSLNRIGYRMRARGFTLGYHHHDFELSGEELEGSPLDGLQVLFSQASHPSLVAELDVFWLAWAGLDPVAYLRSFGPRLHLVHLKDGELPAKGIRKPPEEARFTPLGDGDVDIPAVVRAAIESGARALIVEQDHCDGPPARAISRSRELLDSVLSEIAGEELREP